MPAAQTRGVCHALSDDHQALIQCLAWGRLSSAGTVYRGMSTRVLPEEFWTPNEMNVRQP